MPACLAASREGAFAHLLTVLDPDVVLRVDAVAVRAATVAAAQGAPPLTPEVRGAAERALAFSGRAQAAQPALVEGLPGLVRAPGGGTPCVVFALLVRDGRVVVEVLADPEVVRQLEIELR